MAAAKKIFVEMELQWAEEQLQTWKSYVDDNPLNELADRLSFKTTANGGSIPMVVASIESQGKFVQDTMKNYLALIREVDSMREKEEAKQVARGGGDVPHRMKN